MAQARVKARRASVFGGERFAVFAEALLTGVWIAVASLGLVTYPAAFAAGARHLRRRTGRLGPRAPVRQATARQGRCH
ncbi:hypothetical protein AB0G40_44970, partial [Streptomyces griseorubiginosus]